VTEKKRQANARWAAKNREKVLAYHKKRRQRDRVKMAAQKSAWYRKHAEEVKKRCADYQRERMKKDPLYRMMKRLRTRVSQELVTKRRSVKPCKTMELLGCTREEFKAHIISLLQPGMTMENYGLWHIDHVRAVATFDLSDPEQVKACFHYKNLQPLWAEDNMAKKSIDGSSAVAAERRWSKSAA
jgi:hypothetical protein